jgi:hypothetical protein
MAGITVSRAREILANTVGPVPWYWKTFPAFRSFWLVEVLPQKWFTASQYRVGQQWITRAARDPDSQRIIGECFGVGTFLLEDDGCRLAEWVERTA